MPQNWHGSSWSYVPHGFPARSNKSTDNQFVRALVSPTKVTDIGLSSGKSSRSLSSSKKLTWPHGGFFRPHPEHVVRPNRVSWDRKSTRLNSSHLVISYAVFC